MKKFFFAFFATAIFSLLSLSQMLLPGFLSPDGPVHAMLKSGNTIYLGGDFHFVGPDISWGIGLDSSSAAPLPNFARPDWRVEQAIPDGSGGWFIAGLFTHINGQPRNKVAHINADGSLNPWDPNVTGLGLVYVNIQRSGNTIYLGGSFDHVGGLERRNLAAVDATTGLPTSWYPGATDATTALMFISGNTLYITAYSFLTIGDKHIPPGALVAIDITTGEVNPLDLQASGEGGVHMLLRDNILYVCGMFNFLGGKERHNIGAIDLSTGVVTDWNPGISGDPLAEPVGLAIAGNKLYVSGWFSSVGGQPRNGLAAIDINTGEVDAWNPGPFSPDNPFASVHTLVVDGNTLYAGGYFSSIAGQQRTNLASFNISDGSLTSWKPNVNGGVMTIAPAGNTIYVGGDFTSVNGGGARNNLAAIDITTGKLTPWNPGANGPVYALATDGTTIYAGGDFSAVWFYYVGGTPRNRIAALDPTSGWCKPWDAHLVGATVRAIVLKDSAVCVGGLYDSIGGEARNNLAAVNANTGFAVPWAPQPNDSVLALVMDSDHLFAAGAFSMMGSAERKHLASFDVITGNLQSWSPSANATVRSLSVKNNALYFGGDFTTVNGLPRNSVAAIDVNAANLLAWNPDVVNQLSGQRAFSTVNAISGTGSTVYLGGRFNTAGGQPRNNLASVDAATGTVTSWNANAGGQDVTTGVNAILADPNRVYAAGSFASIQSKSNSNFAVFDNTSQTPLPVSLLSFLAHPQQVSGKWQVNLNWTTANEQNASHFVIERSADGKDFREGGSVKAVGNSSAASSYTFVDHSPLPDISFYKLKQVDMDGSFTYSRPAMVKISNSDLSMMLYPNPVDDHATLTINSPVAQTVDYIIVDPAGRKLKEGRYHLNKGDNRFELPSSGLPANSYTLVINSASGRQRLKFIKR